MITRETIDKIFSAIRVEEIVGEYVQLKRSGSTLKGLSPFVNEKTPSFIVSPSKQIWKDFSSGKGGTAISFLMEIEGFTYPEALRYAAKKYGIEIEEHIRQMSDEEKKAQTDKELLYKIHEVANHFFQEQLHDTEEGRSIGLSYFKERQLKPETIKKFQLGYSPEKRNAFTEYALEKGYTQEILEKSGLSIFTERSPNGVDRFRERVIFPIHSFSGRVLGFGARILRSDVKTAKYLNSPETDIYHKSNILYGLYQSKQAISKEDMCLLVEGYMDVVALHQNGIENVVASSGTSLTQEQIKLIKRVTENVTILFDGDSAGIKASFRSIDMLLSENMNIRVLLFPEGHDPDSFARNNTSEYVKEFIKDKAKDFIDFKAEILLKETDNDPIKRAEAIRDIVKSVAYLPNGLKQEVFLQQIATQFGISEKILFDELHIQQQILKGQTPRKSSLEILKSGEGKAKETVFKETINPLLALEENLVGYLLKYGDVIIERKDENNEWFKTSVAEEIIYHFEEDQYEILSDINKKIIAEIKEGLEKNEIRSGQFFLTLMDEEITGKVADNLIESQETSNWKQFDISFKNEEELIGKVLYDAILRHKREFILEIISGLKTQLETAEEPTEIYRKILHLTELKNKIDHKLFRVL